VREILLAPALRSAHLGVQRSRARPRPGRRQPAEVLNPLSQEPPRGEHPWRVLGVLGPTHAAPGVRVFESADVRGRRGGERARPSRAGGARAGRTRAEAGWHTRWRRSTSSTEGMAELVIAGFG